MVFSHRLHAGSLGDAEERVKKSSSAAASTCSGVPSPLSSLRRHLTFLSCNVMVAIDAKTAFIAMPRCASELGDFDGL